MYITLGNNEPLLQRISNSVQLSSAITIQCVVNDKLLRQKFVIVLQIQAANSDWGSYLPLAEKPSK